MIAGCVYLFIVWVKERYVALERANRLLIINWQNPLLPNLRWVFQCFMSIHLLPQTKQIANFQLRSDGDVFKFLSEILSLC